MSKYENIKNPETGRYVSIYGKLGKKVLANYIEAHQYGGDIYDDVKRVKDFLRWYAQFVELGEYFGTSKVKWGLFNSEHMKKIKYFEELIEQAKDPKYKIEEIKESLKNVIADEKQRQGLINRRSFIHLNYKDYFNNVQFKMMLNFLKNSDAETVFDLTVFDLNNPYGINFLMLYAGIGDTGLVSTLLEAGANVNKKNNLYETPLTSAVLNGHTKIAKLLFENGADVNIKDKSGKTVLMLAIVESTAKMVKLLLENGADINVTDETGKTVLMLSAEHGTDKMVKLLLENGAKPNETVFYFAKQRYEDSKYLLEIELQKGYCEDKCVRAEEKLNMANKVLSVLERYKRRSETQKSH